MRVGDIYSVIEEIQDLEDAARREWNSWSPNRVAIEAIDFKIAWLKNKKLKLEELCGPQETKGGN